MTGEWYRLPKGECGPLGERYEILVTIVAPAPTRQFETIVYSDGTARLHCGVQVTEPQRYVRAMLGCERAILRQRALG